MKKKIVLVNQSAGYLFIDIANAFSEEYDEVVLMAGDVMPMNESLSPLVKVHKIFSYNRGSTVKRMLSWVISLLNIWWLLLIKYRTFHLLVSSNPPTATTLIPLLFKRKISLLIYDIYPDGLVAGNFITSNNVIFKCWSWLNKRAYKKAYRIITLTPGMATAMGAYASIEKIKVVPAWASSSKQDKCITVGENLFLRKYSLEGKFIVMYSGNLGKEYELESLVYLAEQFRYHENITFIIMGNGWKKEILGKLIAQQKLQNCLLLPYQPSDLFLHSLNAFHVGVVSLATAVAKVAIPSKTYNLLAAHKPIFCIGSEESDLAGFLKQQEIGMTIEPEKIAEMKSFIEKLYNDKIYYNRLCNNALTTSNNYTKERAKEMLALIK